MTIKSQRKRSTAVLGGIKKDYTAPKIDLLEFDCIFVSEEEDTYVVDFCLNQGTTETHIVQLPKDDVHLEEYREAGNYRYATFTIPEWVAIELEISHLCRRPQRNT